MNPILAFIISELIKQGPAMAIDLAQLFSKPNPTDADWAALRSKWAGKSYDDYVKPS